MNDYRDLFGFLERARALEGLTEPHRALLDSRFAQPHQLDELAGSLRAAMDLGGERERQLEALAKSLRTKDIGEEFRKSLLPIQRTLGDANAVWLEHLKDLNAGSAWSAFEEAQRHLRLEFTTGNEAIQASLETIRASVGSISSIQDAYSLAGLTSVSGLAHLDPFASSVSEAFLSTLGRPAFLDWNESDLFNWHRRHETYLASGLIPSLTSLPEPTFSEALGWSGLLTPEPVGPESRSPTVYRVRFIQPRQRQAYALISELEQELREFIGEEMTRAFGPQWLKQRVPGPVRTRWLENRKKALAAGEKEHELICYAEFGDYLDVIVRSDNWKEVFEEFFQSPDDLRASFNRLAPLRNVTMHARPLLKDDILCVAVEVKRIRVAIGTAERE